MKNNTIQLTTDQLSQVKGGAVYPKIGDIGKISYGSSRAIKTDSRR